MYMIARVYCSYYHELDERLLPAANYAQCSLARLRGQYVHRARS